MLFFCQDLCDLHVFINTAFKFYKYYTFPSHIHMSLVTFNSLLNKDLDVLTLRVASGVLLLKSPNS